MILRQIKSLTTGFLLSLSVIVLTSCYGSSGSDRNEEEMNAASIPAVEAVQARYGSLPLSERLSGTVIAENQVALYPEISGKIARVYVDDGESVQQGTPIVALEDRQYREQVNQARATLRINEARLKQARAEYVRLEAQYRRIKQLSEQNLSSELQMETLQAQLTSAEADVELAEAQLEQAKSNLEEQQELLSKTVIRAPIDGTVGRRNAEIGMQVGSNTQLFTIGNLANLRIEVVLTEEMLGEVQIGQPVHIYTGTDDSSNVIEGKLSRISPFLDTVTRSTEAEIEVTGETRRLRPGMFVPVDILYGASRQATIIPTSALYTDPNTGKEGVYIATSLGDEIEPVEQVDTQNPPPLTSPTPVTFRPVDVIAEGRMRIGVEGVESGSWIVTVGQDLLSGSNGQARVRTSSWERILNLQGLQRQDLLQRVLESE